MKTLNVIAFLLLSFQSLGANWNGCYDIAKDPDTKLKKNKSTQICFSTGPGGDWGMGVQYKRYSFQPDADEYSKFTVPGCKSIVSF